MCKDGKSCCSHGCWLRITRKVLLLIGGLNWGLVGVGMLMGSDWNVVHMLLGSWPMVEAIVYVLVGLAAVFKLCGCHCKKCMRVCEECATSDGEAKM